MLNQRPSYLKELQNWKERKMICLNRMKPLNTNQSNLMLKKNNLRGSMKP